MVRIQCARVDPSLPPSIDNSCDALSCRLLAPVVIYCASGRRASKAEEVLKKKGYARVYNAGGLRDMPKEAVEEKSNCSIM